MINKRPNISSSQTVKIYLPMVILLSWMFVVYTGNRLPYLRTQIAFQIRFLLIFPLLSLLFIYFIFIFRRYRGGSAYSRRMESLPSKTERHTAAFLAFIGIIVIPWFIALTSTAFPAWATSLFAKRRYENAFSVERIAERSGPGFRTLFDLTLKDLQSKEQVNLSLPYAIYKEHSCRQGDTILLTGRTWTFGTIVERYAPL